jgi:hypothetical protein
MTAKRFGDFRVFWWRGAGEAVMQADEYAAQAVATLSSVLSQNGFSKHFGETVFQALDRGDLIPSHIIQLKRAGVPRLGIHQDHASAAVLTSAAEPCSLQSKFVAQSQDQRRRSVDAHFDWRSIDCQGDSHAWIPPASGKPFR